MVIPMSQADITSVERGAVLDVLSSATLAVGPRLELFEQRLAAAGARHGVAVSSGTAGLHLCVVAPGVREGDAGLTTPFSSVASASARLTTDRFSAGPLQPRVRRPAHGLQNCLGMPCHNAKKNAGATLGLSTSLFPVA
jgi:hypothetical protein